MQIERELIKQNRNYHTILLNQHHTMDYKSHPAPRPFLCSFMPQVSSLEYCASHKQVGVVTLSHASAALHDVTLTSSVTVGVSKPRTRRFERSKVGAGYDAPAYRGEATVSDQLEDNEQLRIRTSPPELFPIFAHIYPIPGFVPGSRMHTLLLPPTSPDL